MGPIRLGISTCLLGENVRYSGVRPSDPQGVYALGR
jgi:uncharacterized protein YbbK (DUF523 family)